MEYIYLYLIIGVCVEFLIEYFDVFGLRKKERMIKEQTLMINPNYYNAYMRIADFVAKTAVHTLAVIFWFVRVYRFFQYFNALRKDSQF